MKRLLIMALVALLVATAGTFGYTYTTATATIDVNVVESDFAEIVVAEAEEEPTAPTVFGRFTGTWPTGTLFTITPAEDYQGDLVIKVYLVNTGQLIRYYHHCNMALEFRDDEDDIADEQEIFQVLNLQNAAVEFNWANGTGDSPYKVELTGGSFRLHHWKALLTGGSTTPQIWCEVTQR